jgi:Lrp/AsnC family leucine-responsive transcriptional regulator
MEFPPMTFLSNTVTSNARSSFAHSQSAKMGVTQLIQEKALDAQDVKILRMLSQDGRITWRDLADKIGLSLTPTLRRVRRLEKEGYIKGYAATLDESRILGSICVFVSVTMERQCENVLAEFETRIARIPEVLSCFQMTGAADYLVRVTARDIESFQQLLAELARIPGVAHTQSSFAIKPVVRTAGVSL